MCARNFLRTQMLNQLSYTPEIFEEAPFKVQNLVCISTGGPTRFAPLMIFGQSISVQKSHRLTQRERIADNARARVTRANPAQSSEFNAHVETSAGNATKQQSFTDAE